MNIDWHMVNEVVQWIVIARIYYAICNNNAKIMKAFSRLNKRK